MLHGGGEAVLCRSWVSKKVTPCRCPELEKWCSTGTWHWAQEVLQGTEAVRAVPCRIQPWRNSSLCSLCLCVWEYSSLLYHWTPSCLYEAWSLGSKFVSSIGRIVSHHDFPSSKQHSLLAWTLLELPKKILRRALQSSNNAAITGSELGIVTFPCK